MAQKAGDLQRVRFRTRHAKNARYLEATLQEGSTDGKVAETK